MAANTHSLDLESSSSQYAYASDTSDLQFGSGDFTVMCWVRREAISGDYPIFSKHNGSTEGIRLFFRTENTLRLDMTQSSATDEIYGSSVITSTSTWYHIAVTRSGTTVTLYINGASDGSGTSSKSVSASGTNFEVGRMNSGGFAYWDGLIDEFRVYKGIALTADQINAIKTKKVVDRSELKAYWKLNNDYEDVTTNNRDLTSSGSPSFSTTVPFANYSDPGAAILLSLL